MTDYTQVTETPGIRLSREAIAMNYHRYQLAADLCHDKDVLEVGCGAGQGLGSLSRHARSIVGGDYDLNLIRSARSHYEDRVPLLRLDAHQLPFRDESFDVILLYEAIYYLRQPQDFFRASRRLLRRDGMVVICSINREWPDFNPSPLSTRYFSGDELVQLLRQHQFTPSLYGSFPVSKATLADRSMSLIKRLAVAMNLIPRTMKGKEFLKRLFCGRLVAMPSELTDDFAVYVPPQPLEPASPIEGYKVLYAVGRIA